jgi:uncharacterized protein involved in exopolysaccharide biosynthesis
MTFKITGETITSETTDSLSIPPDESSWLDILVIVTRRWRFVGLFTLAAAILTIVIVLLIPNKYTAQSIVMPPNQNSSLSSMLLGQMAGSSPLASLAGSGLGLKNPGDMYVSLFRSRTVEDAVIEHFGLMRRYRKKNMVDTRKAFEERSTVIIGVKDNLIRVDITDRDPRLAAELVNAYVDEFRKNSDTLAITEASQRRRFFQQQLLEAEANLAAAEDAFKRTQQSTGVLQIDSQAKALIESAAVLRAQVAAKEVQLQSMRSFATEDNPQYAMAEQELDALKSQLAKLSGTEQNNGSDIIVPGGNIPQAGLEYLNKLRDVRYYETIEELIAKQFELAKLDEAREGAIVQVADVAVPPDKKSAPHRALIVVLMTLIAFVIAVLWVLSAERWQQMLRDPEKGAKVGLVRQALFNSRR